MQSFPSVSDILQPFSLSVSEILCHALCLNVDFSSLITFITARPLHCHFMMIACFCFCFVLQILIMVIEWKNKKDNDTTVGALDSWQWQGRPVGKNAGKIKDIESQLVNTSRPSYQKTLRTAFKAPCTMLSCQTAGAKKERQARLPFFATLSYLRQGGKERKSSEPPFCKKEFFVPLGRFS